LALREIQGEILSLFNELKRRNVFRVGIAYVVAVWVIAQVADLVLDNIGAPQWVMQSLLLLLAIGFVVAMIIAWAYEFTPEGIKREGEVVRRESVTHHTAKRLDMITIGLVVVAIGLLLADRLLFERMDQNPTARDAAVSDAGLQPAATPSAEANLKPNQSIAVLPFVNMSDDASNEYFSEGLSEELLNLLVRIPELKVAARTSSFSYKGKDTKIAQIGEELGVAYVLEGSVRKSGDHVRITAQLIQASDGFHLWSQTYDRTLEDIFVTQDEIAKAVVDNLKITLLGTMPEVRKTDPEVYSLYLQGTYFINLGGEENLEKALAALKQALAIDPDYARAWVNLDWAYETLSYTNPAARDEFRAPRIEAIERALAIDENYAYAWAALAYQRTSYDSDWHGARIAIEKALRLEPNNADVIGAAAWLASATGRLPEAIELYEKAVSLDPLNQSNLIELGRRYLRVGRIDDAFYAYDRVRAINPDHTRLNFLLGRVYMMRGDLENALLETEKSPDRFFYRHQKATFLYMMGKETEAQTLINELLETSADDVPGAMALVYAWRGEGDSAFEWLEIAYEQGDTLPDFFLGHLFWRKLTGDPRYSAHVEKIGLLEEWKAMPPEYGGPPAQ
jgi:TolB-like protein/Flp pilus assembly protein TadD